MGSGFRLHLKWLLTHQLLLEWMFSLLFRHWHLTLFESTCNNSCNVEGSQCQIGVIKGTGQWKLSKKISQFWKSTKKWISTKKKVDIYISYSVSCSLQPTNPTTKTSCRCKALIPWVSVFSHQKWGKEKERPKRRGDWWMGMGMENVEMAGNFFPVDREKPYIIWKTLRFIGWLRDAPQSFVGGIFSC